MTKSRILTGRNLEAKDRARQIKDELAAIEATLQHVEVDESQGEHLSEIRNRLRDEQYEISRKL